MHLLIEAGSEIDYLITQLPRYRSDSRVQLSRLVAASIADELESIYATLLVLRPRLYGLGIRVPYLLASFLRHPLRPRLRELKARLRALETPP